MSEVKELGGSAIGGYRIRELVGRGGMGRVYLAQDERLDRPVALKVLAEELARDGAFRVRLLRESRLAAGLDHPNVVPVYEAGERDGRLFIAMRYVAGPDLAGILRAEGALAPRRVMALASQIAAALDAAHARDLVHRDVKPSNVLVDRQGGHEHCYLADFGLTRSISSADAPDGQMVGTIDYVAPEQVRGDTVDGRADQYALACLMFECLTGTLPYGSRSDVATLFSHLEEDPPRASERRPELPAALDGVLARAMAKEPAERFASCGDLVEAASEELGIGVGGGHPRRRAVPVLVALLLALLAAVGVLAAALDRGGEAPAAAPAGALVRIDSRTNRVAARVRVPGHPGPIAVTRGGVWTGDFQDGVLWRYEPSSGDLQRVSTNGEPRDITAAGPQLYVATDGNEFTGLVSRYDAFTGERIDDISLVACALTSGEGVVWVAGCPYVQRLSTGSDRLHKLAEVPLPFLTPATADNGRVQFREMTIGQGSLWVLGDALDRRLWRLDARTGRLQDEITLRFPPRSIAIAGGLAWITDNLHDTVVPVDLRRRHVLPAIKLGRLAAGIATAAGSVWVAETLGGTVARIDPVRRRVVGRVRTGGLPLELAAGRGGLWVSSDAP